MANILKFTWWKAVIIIALEGVLLYVFRKAQPICGYDPSLASHPRCATLASDILLAILIILFLYLVATIVYSLIMRKKKA